jgi:endonuclease/exonuclease/phosphatase family metal-dependent hydrolase
MHVSRAVLTTCAMAAALAVTSPLSAQPEPQAGDRPLRVMSYNIKHGQTNEACTTPPRVPGEPPPVDCGLDLQASIDVIKSFDPDIIGMQEIDRFWARSAYLDEPAVLSQALGLEHVCYAPNLDHPADTHSPVPHQYGTVILSRYPILECTNLLLRRVANEEQRGLTTALINVRGVPLQFYNTHLHTTQAARLLQTADIAAVLDAAPAGPKVMTGDFNARSTFDTAAIELEPIHARLTDAWRAAPLPEPQNPQGFTSSARLEGLPTSRIDYVFVSSGVAAGGTFVPITSATRLAADHYPVVADIALPGAAVGVGRLEGKGTSKP